VGVKEGHGHLAHDLSRVVELENSALLQDLGKGPAFHELLGHIMETIDSSEIKDLHDAGVSKALDGFGLAGEPPYEFALVCRIGTCGGVACKDLQGNQSSEAGIEGFVDGAESSPTKDL
jgi:hypothetical protein